MSSYDYYTYADPLKLVFKHVQKINNDKKNEDWFLDCEWFTQEKKENPKLSYGKFLDSDATDPIFPCKKSQKYRLVII